MAAAAVGASSLDSDDYLGFGFRPVESKCTWMGN